jgi:hypothetical protein
MGRFLKLISYYYYNMNTESDQEQHLSWDSEQDLDGFQPVPKKHSFRTDFSKIHKKQKSFPEKSESKKNSVSREKRPMAQEKYESNKKQYLETLQEARDIALYELKLSKDTLLENSENGLYKKTVLRCHDDIWKNDDIELKGLKFSRHKFYLKREFKTILDKYYQELGYSSRLILARGNRWILKINLETEQ